LSPDASDRAAPIVTFLSDYGYTDEFVGVCHCVLARRCPAARIIDLGHGLPHHDIRAGALALRAALPYAPAGVHLAVVDPGVGSDRRALALRTREEARILVGPDNGLLLPAAALFGGVSEAVDISDSPEALRPISATFHGRDVFAAVAAALADGVPMEAAGRAIEPASVIALELPAPKQERDSLHAHVLSIGRRRAPGARGRRRGERRVPRTHVRRRAAGRARRLRRLARPPRARRQSRLGRSVPARHGR
jgi:hypothetical protein